MRLAVMLLCSIPVLCFAQAVTRTGANSVKIPVSAGSVRVSCPDCEEAPATADRTVCASGCTDTTIASMVSNLAAGQIGEIRANSVGGSRTFTGSICLDLTNIDGSANSPITIRVRDGDSITFDCSTYGIKFEGTDYVVVDGQGGLTIGDVTDWSQSDAGTGYSQDQAIQAANSTYIAIKNLTAYGGSSFWGTKFERTCHHVWVKDSVFDLHGTNNDVRSGSPNFGNDRGDLFALNSRYSLVEGSSFSHGGHNTFVLLGGNTIARDNVFDGNWVDKSTGFAGSRSMSIETGNNQTWDPDNVFTTEFGPSIVENSILKRAGRSVDSAQNAAAKLQGRHTIFRGNYIWDTDGVVWLGPGYSDFTLSGAGMGRISAYNNTSFSSKSVYYTTDNLFPSGASATNGEGDWYYNNIFQQVQTGGSPFSAIAVLRDENVVPNGSHPNGWKSGGWDSNIIGGTSTSKQFRLVDTSSNTVSWANTAQWPSNINRNIDTTITFVNAAARTKAGFALADSNTVAIGDARHITTTTDSGTNDTTLTLENAYPFTYGWTLDFSKIGGTDETGDCIAVTPTSGGTASDAVVTQITGITYSTGAIAVNPGVTHAVGSKVWPATKNADGSCGAIWDNRGAAQ